MRKILFSATLLAANVAHGQTTSEPLADVATHATATDCWMVVNTTDIFMPSVSMHPGGGGRYRRRQMARPSEMTVVGQESTIT